ncbi:ADP-ribosylation factor [Hysterangium stoloniferum]|nr:ADP-ribosylation factor [Hysterangium stoloniferum]
MSVFQQLFSRLFPTKTRKIVIYGLPSGGKTTFLYQLKLGQTVTTIPSIGFNVETISISTASGTFNAEMWDVSGGCGKLGNLIYHYLLNTDALIWVVDSANHDYLDESIEELVNVLKLMDNELENKGALGRPILVLANKQDLPDAMSLDSLKARFTTVFKDKGLVERPYHIFPLVSTRSVPISGMPEALGWLRDRLNRSNVDIQTNNDAEAQSSSSMESDLRAIVQQFPSQPNARYTPQQKFMSYLARSELDVPPEEFYDKFTKFVLPTWDHYAHLRVAYVALTMFGRQKGKNIIFDGIQKYIAESTQSAGRTFHMTMTYFWIQIVHFGIRSMSASLRQDAQSNDMTPGPNDFSKFLLFNPYVTNGLLWSDYYSKGVMISPAAKSEMVLPDKKSLPNLVMKETIRA